MLRRKAAVLSPITYRARGSMYFHDDAPRAFLPLPLSAFGCGLAFSRLA